MIQRSLSQLSGSTNKNRREPIDTEQLAQVESCNDTSDEGSDSASESGEDGGAGASGGKRPGCAVSPALFGRSASGSRGSTTRQRGKPQRAGTGSAKRGPGVEEGCEAEHSDTKSMTSNEQGFEGSKKKKRSSRGSSRPKKPRISEAQKLGILLSKELQAKGQMLDSQSSLGYEDYEHRRFTRVYTYFESTLRESVLHAREGAASAVIGSLKAFCDGGDPCFAAVAAAKATQLPFYESPPAVLFRKGLRMSVEEMRKSVASESCIWRCAWSAVQDKGGAENAACPPSSGNTCTYLATIPVSLRPGGPDGPACRSMLHEDASEEQTLCIFSYPFNKQAFTQRGFRKELRRHLLPYCGKACPLQPPPPCAHGDSCHRCFCRKEEDLRETREYLRNKCFCHKHWGDAENAHPLTVVVIADLFGHWRDCIARFPYFTLYVEHELGKVLQEIQDGTAQRVLTRVANRLYSGDYGFYVSYHCARSEYRCSVARLSSRA